jgi:putative transposase
MLEKENTEMSLRHQCRILKIPRSGLYYVSKKDKEKDLEIMLVIDKIFLEQPTLGTRGMKDQLWRKHQIVINRKRIQRLYALMGLTAIYPRSCTSNPGKGHKIYPYLLRNLPITKVNQVWATDITYLPMKKGFMYLMAVIDLYSRKVIHWGLSNSMDADWCTTILKESLDKGDKPDIFNTDQGSQFTSDVFTAMLTDNGIKISMDGKGRATDNAFIERLWRSLKQERIYLNMYENGKDLWNGVRDWMQYYNGNRGHKSLKYQTPNEVYQAA